MIFLIVIFSAFFIFTLMFTKGKTPLRYLFYFWLLCFHMGPRGEEFLGMRIFFIEGITWLVFFVLLFRFNLFLEFRKVFSNYTIALFIAFIICVFTAVSYNRDFIKMSLQIRFVLSIIPVFFITYIGFKFLAVKLKTVIKIFAIGVFILGLFAALSYFYPSIGNLFPTSRDSSLVDTSEDIVTYAGDLFKRGGGGLWDPGLISAYFLLLFFPIYMQRAFEKNFIKKNIYIFLLGLILVTVIINGQRSAWLGLLLGWAFFSLLRGFKGVFIGILFFFILIRFLPAEVFSRFFSIFTVSDTTWTGRVSRYSDAQNIIREHPFFGIGCGGSGWVHNFILEFWADLGLIGLSIFLLWLGKLFFRSVITYRKCNEPKELKMYLLAFLASSISFLMPMAGESTIDHPYLVIPFWFFCAILHNFNNGNIGSSTAQYANAQKYE